MKISDELIACYVEGTVTAEERNFVRRYLCEHPETYEHILCLMEIGRASCRERVSDLV